MVLLSSSAFDDPLLFPFLLTQTGRAAAQLRVAVVISASPQGASGPMAVKTMDFLRAAGVSHAAFVDLDDEDARAALEAADVVLLNGGSPFRLLGKLRASGLADLIRTRAGSAVIVGVSAGGMVLGADLSLVADFNRLLGFDNPDDTEGLDDLTGLGLFDEAFFPHLDRFAAQVEGLADRLDHLEARTGTRLFRQCNGETAAVQGRSIGRLRPPTTPASGTRPGLCR